MNAQIQEEEEVNQQITVGTRVQLINYNGKKYKKSRTGAHLVGTQPNRADLWIDQFQPMTVIHMEKDTTQPAADAGEYWMFGFEMGGLVWYGRVWVFNGQYRPTFFGATVHLEVME